MIETSTVTVRRRRVMAGEGMVTPRRPMAVEEDGKVETLIPRRDRLSIDHPLVARQPEKFDLCWDKDRETRARLREYHVRALRHIERELGERPAPGRSSLRVPTGRENRRAVGHRYGRRHKELRRHFARRMARGEVFNCWRCGKLIDPLRPWDLGHVRDNTAAGGERWPEHRLCNRQTLTHLKERLAKAEGVRPPGESRVW